MKVLVIEDSAEVVEAISLCVQIRWPEVVLSVAAEGNKGIEMLKADSFDVIILDINLPDIDGFTVLERIRSFSNVPIIIVTVREKEEDQARGLEMGADDYIVKPFRPRDLVGRVNAVLRRANVTEAGRSQARIIRGKLSLTLDNSEVRFGDLVRKLTPTEARLLYVLMQNADETVTSGRILQEVWRNENTSHDTIRTYVRRLRQKLSDKPPRIILTEQRRGYRFMSPV